MGALVLAVAMITAAFWVRDHLDHPQDRSANSTSTPATLVCASELQAACETLATAHPEVTVRMEEVAVTLSRLSALDFDGASATGTAAIDGWLVPEPWPQMVAEARQRAGSAASSLSDASAVVARSPLVLAVWNDRRDALSARCPAATITWRCIGDVAGTAWGSTGVQSTWGAVKPGHPTPDQTAVGLLVLGQATSGYFGRATFASNDFADPAFRSWFERLERAVPTFPVPPRTPLDDMLFSGPASFDLTGSTEAAAGPAITSSRDRDRTTILYPAPLTTADVVLAPVAGSPAGDRLMKLIESKDGLRALAQAGWRVDGQPLAAGVPDQPSLLVDSNVPKAGVLQALRSLWNQVVR